MKYPDADPLNDQLHAFVHAIRTGTEPVVTGEDGRTALRVAVAIIGQIAGGTKNFQGID
jgi:predicted dehydrogenase